MYENENSAVMPSSSAAAPAVSSSSTTTGNVNNINRRSSDNDSGPLLSVMMSRASYHGRGMGSHSPPTATRRLSQNQNVLTSRQDFAKLQSALVQMANEETR